MPNTPDRIAIQWHLALILEAAVDRVMDVHRRAARRRGGRLDKERQADRADVGGDAGAQPHGEATQKDVTGLSLAPIDVDEPVGLEKCTAPAKSDLTSRSYGTEATLDQPGLGRKTAPQQEALPGDIEGIGSGDALIPYSEDDLEPWGESAWRGADDKVGSVT